MATESSFFQPELVEYLEEIINDNCSNGDGLKLEDLYTKAKEGWEEVATLSPKTLDNVIVACLNETVGKRLGPNGGYHLKGVEASKRAPGVSPGISRTYTDEEIDEVRRHVVEGLKLNNGKGIQTGFVAGRLNKPEVDFNNLLGYVSGAVAHMAEFEIKRGKGICRKVTEPTAPVPPPDVPTA